MSTTPAIDYDVIRIAMLGAMRWAIGFDQNQVIMAEPEVSDAPRPALPYIAMKIDTPSHVFGRDVQAVDDGDVSVTYGPRSMQATFTAYGNSHEEAQGIATTWQGMLQSMPVQEMLREANISVLSVADVADVSMLLDTGYEGRAALKVTFGAVSYLARQASSTLTIESAQIIGNASGASITTDVITEDAP